VGRIDWKRPRVEKEGRRRENGRGREVDV